MSGEGSGLFATCTYCGGYFPIRSKTGTLVHHESAIPTVSDGPTCRGSGRPGRVDRERLSNELRAIIEDVTQDKPRRDKARKALDRLHDGISAGLYGGDTGRHVPGGNQSMRVEAEYDGWGDRV